MADQTSLNLGLTVADISAMFAGFNFSTDSALISLMMEMHTSALEVVCKQQGFKVEEVSTTKHKRLYNICRMIIIFRVSSEMIEIKSHEQSAIADKRRFYADRLERRIIDMPESCSDDWNGEEHSGSWEFDTDEVAAAAQHLGLVNWSCFRPI